MLFLDIAFGVALGIFMAGNASTRVARRERPAKPPKPKSEAPFDLWLEARRLRREQRAGEIERAENAILRQKIHAFRPISPRDFFTLNWR